MHILNKLRMLRPFKYDGSIFTITGKSIVKANRDDQTPLRPTERDSMLKLIAGGLDYVTQPFTLKEMSDMAYKFIPVDADSGSIENDIDAAKRALYFKGLKDMQELILERIAAKTIIDATDKVDFIQFTDKCAKL